MIADPEGGIGGVCAGSCSPLNTRCHIGAKSLSFYVIHGAALCKRATCSLAQIPLRSIESIASGDAR